MYIQNIIMKNFRNFENKTLSFKPGLNVLFGSSGSGKSNVLHAIIIAMNGCNL